MRKSIKIISSVAALLLVIGGAANAEKWSFGVMSDTQWSTSDAANNPNTVAVGIINQLNTQFINKGVKFVVQVGDLCDKEGTSNAGLQTRLNATSALTAAGIPFYGLRGNHEGSATAQTFFQNNYIPASNADATVNVAPDATSYSVTYNNTKLVLLDISVAGNVANLNTQTTWMDGELKAADHNQAFVFAHKNMAGQNHKDVLFGSNLDANLPQQNAFIGALGRNNVRYFASGHDHIHNRSIIASPDGKNSVEQLICSSNSYKFYTPAAPYSNRETQISQELYTVGYYIYTVDGTKVTVDFYSSPKDVNTGNGNDLTATPVLNFSLRESWGYDLATVNLTGTVNLADYSAGIGKVGVVVELLQNGVVAQTYKVFPDDSGRISIAAPVGTYDVAVKGASSLRTVVSNVTISIGSIADLGTVNLVNGDIDGDNEVTSTDLSILGLNLGVAGA